MGNVEIVGTHFLWLKANVPCGVTRSGDHIEDAGNKNNGDQACDAVLRVCDQDGQEILPYQNDEIIQEFANTQDPPPLGEFVEQGRGKDNEKAGNIGDKGKDAHIYNVNVVSCQKARIKNAGCDISKEPLYYHVDEDATATFGIGVFEVENFAELAQGGHHPLYNLWEMNTFDFTIFWCVFQWVSWLTFRGSFW